MHEFNHKWIHANLVSSFTLIQIHLHVEHVYVHVHAVSTKTVIER